MRFRMSPFGVERIRDIIAIIKWRNEKRKKKSKKFYKMFPHFVGYDGIRLEMAQLIDLVENRGLYAKKVIQFSRGWLLYGNLETGKMHLVKDIIDHFAESSIAILNSHSL